jgi:hypothetical protein
MDAAKRLEMKRLTASVLQSESQIANYELQQEELQQSIDRISVQIDGQKNLIEENKKKLSQLTQ